jgi:hypothetical protein
VLSGQLGIDDARAAEVQRLMGVVSASMREQAAGAWVWCGWVAAGSESNTSSGRRDVTWLLPACRQARCRRLEHGPPAWSCRCACWAS